MLLEGLVGIYILAVGLGFAVAFAVFTDLHRRGDPDARRKGLAAVAFALLGLFIVPLVRHLLTTR
jgi:hypothetical protein